MSNPEIKRFGQKLHTLRIQSGMTLKDLAVALGYTAHGYISEIEVGKKRPSIDFVLSLARLFEVTTDQLLKDELELDTRETRKPMSNDSLSLPNSSDLRMPTQRDIEKLRLILSIFQDGTGQLKRGSITLPGWRDFERAAAVVFDGEAPEGKQILDIVFRTPTAEGKYYGVSCKMKQIKVNDAERAYIELSNASKSFWRELEKRGLERSTYRQHPLEVGQIIINLVKEWHKFIKIPGIGRVEIDRSKSFYLILSWDESTGLYQLHQLPFELPEPTMLRWEFPLNVRGEQNRLVGHEESGRLFEWYAESGGQLKYYPRFSTAFWKSNAFRLEPLPPNSTPYTLLGKVEAYFPAHWRRVFIE
jgi:transcriptional regulator with XRE-family HTH domain